MENSDKWGPSGPTPPAHGRSANRILGYGDQSPLTFAIQQLTTRASAECWASVSALGTIVTTPDDRPIRSIVTGRRRVVTGSYASRKARRAMPHESMNELAFFHLSEVETTVVDYRSQPFRVEFVLDGKHRVYIADCARLLADGAVEVIEIKSDRRSLKDPDYAAKLGTVGQICKRIGWRFKIVLKEELLLPPAWRKNIVLVQSQRHVRYSAPDLYRAFDLMDREGGETDLGRLAHSLGDPRRGRAVAMAMMVGRIVEIDLCAPLSDGSRVRALPSSRHSNVEAGQ